MPSQSNPPASCGRGGSVPAHPSHRRPRLPKRAVLIAAALAGLAGCAKEEPPLPKLDPTLVAQGKDIFRYDTFGDETFWTDTLQMNQVIEAAVDPTTALSVGLK